MGKLRLTDILLVGGGLTVVTLVSNYMASLDIPKRIITTSSGQSYDNVRNHQSQTGGM